MEQPAAGAALRAARALLGWTQGDLAMRSRVSLPTVRRLEAGVAAPRLTTAARLARCLAEEGVEVGALREAGRGLCGARWSRPRPRPLGSAVPSPGQVRAGRALLGWTIEDAARRWGVAAGTLARYEAGGTEPRAETALRVAAGLRAAGVRLLDESGAGAGRGAALAAGGGPEPASALSAG